MKLLIQQIHSFWQWHYIPITTAISKFWYLDTSATTLLIQPSYLYLNIVRLQPEAINVFQRILNYDLDFTAIAFQSVFHFNWLTSALIPLFTLSLITVDWYFCLGTLTLGHSSPVSFPDRLLVKVKYAHISSSSLLSHLPRFRNLDRNFSDIPLRYGLWNPRLVE
jgi:hypothetical protein